MAQVTQNSHNAASLADSDEANEIISTIRALTVSQKEMTSEQDLMRDYKQLNGEVIPYRKFGFKSLEQFLMASGEFTIRRNANGAISISAKPSKESLHIVALIQKQKSNSTGKKKRVGVSRKPLSVDQSWQKTSYSNTFYNLPSPKKSLQSFVQKYTQHRSSTSPKTINNNTNVKNRNLVPNNKENLDNFQLVTTQNFKVQDVRAKGREHLVGDTKKVDKPQVNTNLSRQNSREQQLQQQHQMQQKPIQQPKQPDNQRSNHKNIVNSNNTQPPIQTNTNKIPPLLNNNYIGQNNMNIKISKTNNSGGASNKATIDESNKTKLQSRIDMANAIAQHQELQAPANNSSATKQRITIQNDPPKAIPPLMSLQVTIPTHNHSAPMLKSSLQDRLIVKKPLDNPVSYTKLPPKTPPTPSNSSPPALKASSFAPTNIAPPPLNMNPSEELAYYCQTHNYPKPTYNTFKITKSDGFHCKVTVNGVAYATYPNEYPKAIEAQYQAAQNALKQLKEEEMRTLYPVCAESDFNIAIKMYNKLKDYPYGVFSKDFPDMFQNTYERTLPDSWFSVVVSSPQLFAVEETTPGTYILFAYVRDSDSSSVSATSETEVTTSHNEKLSLPWSLEHWDLYITNPVSTIQIWARIIGPEYSEKMDSLLTDIDMAMLTDKQRAQTVQIGYIYLVSVSDCWYRVRVNELDFEQNRCLCFFIDIGDADWYSMDQLFTCESRFMKFPAQAISFSLFGLEDFDENPHAKQELLNLAGRTLIGKIFTKQEEYEMQEESSNFEARVKVVLYDTSSDDDLNLNPLILQRICESTPPPQFERTGVTHVNITYIKSNGDIYCQIKDSGIFYIEKLINNLIESKLNEEVHSGLYQDKKTVNQYYLVFDDKDKKWYRAIIEQFGTAQDEYKLFYIDYGITRVLKTKRILRTDSLSAALHRFPQQGVRIRLSGIQNFNDNIMARLRGLLKSGTPAIVKIMTPATIPLVNVFTRLPVSNVLFNVNETLRLEQEMEQSAEINQNVANLKQSLSSSSTVTALTSSSVYRSSHTISSNSSLNSIKTNHSKNGSTSMANSPDSGSSLNDLSIQFRNVDINSTPNNKLDLSKLKPPVYPPLDELTYVRVSMASNPNYFVIQPHEDAQKLHEMMTELQTHCTNSKEFIPSDCVKIGEVYGALHADGMWYRATVENIYGPTMIHVCYCDFGDVTVLSSEKLKILPFKFRALPRQASKAKLHGIKPKFGDWSMEDCLYFQQLTVDKTFASIIRSISDDEMNKDKLLELILVDVSGETDILIHELLIQENRAAPC